MKFHVLPFGCQMNRSDAERVRGVLHSMGYEESEDDDHPDVVIKGIISCSVRQKAIDRVYGKIRKWNREKAGRPVLTFVSGCVLPADRRKFLKMFDLVFPIDRLPELPDMIRQYGVPVPGGLVGLPAAGPDAAAAEAEAPAVDAVLSSGAVPSAPVLVPFGIGAPEVGRPGREEAARRIEAFWNLEPEYSSPVEAFVPIQNGCDKFCTYCAVPYTRGREVSRPSVDILAEVRFLVERGCRSVTLLGQNVNSYGRDKKGAELSFPELMAAIGEIGWETGADFWTYFTSPHPRDVTRDLLETMAEYGVLAKWIHLPLQSGDDEVLKRMNRNHSMDRYRSLVADIRDILPGCSLFTDIIVGFTGETEAQFDATADAMREFRYDMAYIAQYSPRPGAASAEWEDDVPKQEKERRFRLLSDLLVNLAAPANAARVGGIEKVLVTGADRKSGFLSGHTEGRIPVRLRAEGAAVGEFVDVEIISARPLSIEGAVAETPGDRL